VALDEAPKHLADHFPAARRYERALARSATGEGRSGLGGVGAKQIPYRQFLLRAVGRTEGNAQSLRFVANLAKPFFEPRVLRLEGGGLLFQNRFARGDIHSRRSLSLEIEAAHALYRKVAQGARDDAVAMRCLVPGWTYDPKRPSYAR